MSLWHDELPPLDIHAHIAPDVTAGQLENLGSAHVFAVTRDLLEADVAADRSDPTLTWGCGTHPGSVEALEAFSIERFTTLLPRFALVGEVGLDGRAGSKDRQALVFNQVLEIVADAPVIVSIHSAGALDGVLDALANRRHTGAVLHWFTGDADQLKRALALGCYMSVNGAMSDEALRGVPLDRVLPETDFPSAKRRGGGSRPGDTRLLEQRLARLWQVDEVEVRARLYRNLRAIASASGAIERLGEELADQLMLA